MDDKTYKALSELAEIIFVAIVLEVLLIHLVFGIFFNG